MNSLNYTIDAAFISGGKGQLYSIHYAPAPTNNTGECLVVSPAFAEELNRCRYMCTMLAQSVAGQGVGFLSVDPYGTGDSEGDFSELSWAQLEQDLLCACNYAIELGYKKVSILGVRMGALPALQVAQKFPHLSRIVLWQPEINGQIALTQLLRLKIAGTLDRKEEGGSTKEFEALAEDGQHIEIAGYRLSPELICGMKQARLEDHLSYSGVEIGWFNTIASEERKSPRAHTKLIDAWRHKGADIVDRSVIGPPYWQVHERTLAPNLIATSTQYICGVLRNE